MTDIYDIKDIVLGFPINIINSFIFLFFIFISFIFIKYVLKNQKKIKKSKTVIIGLEQVIQKKDFNKIIKKFKKEHIQDNFDKFYGGLLMILREILKDKGYRDITNMTFKELSSLKLKSNVKELIKSIYFKEYMKKIEDNIEIREKYIKDIINLIK